MNAPRMKVGSLFNQPSIPLIALLLCSAILVGGMVITQGFFTVGVILSLCLVLWMIAWPEAATLVFTFILYINLPVVASKFHNLPQEFAAASVLILLIPVVSYIVIHRQPFVLTPTLILFLILIVIMLISAIAADVVKDSMDVLVTYATEGFLLYFLVSNIVRTQETLRRVIWVLILAGMLMGGLSLYQEVTRTHDNNYLGFAQVDVGGFKTGEDLEGSVYRQRLAGPIGEKNRYAQILLAIFPLALFRIWAEKSLFLKGLAVVGILLILTGILLTFSRGAAVAMVGLLLITTVWGYLKPYQTVLVLIALTALILVVAPDFILRLDSLRGITGVISEEGDNPDGAIVGRETSNIAAFNTFLDYPVLGVGPGQYYKQYSQQYANELGLRFFADNRRAHNMYLETAADLGVIGLSVLLGIFATTIYQLDRLRKYWSGRHPGSANIATAFLLSIISYMATAVFLHLSYLRYLSLLLALANAAIYICRRDASALVSDRSEPVYAVDSSSAPYALTSASRPQQSE